MERVLIIDEDRRVLNTLRDHLYNAGFAPITALDGLAGLTDFYNQHPNLIILDLRIPRMDGWTLVSRIREVSHVPVIVLTTLQAEADKLRAFALGVDDYVTKPCSCAEIVARAKAILKRANRNGAETSQIITAGELTIDLSGRRVLRQGAIVELTPTEFRLLATLAHHQGRPLSHEYLLDQVWGYGYEGEVGYLKRYVWALRRKLEDDPDAPMHIVTERGFGYCFE